MKRRHRHVWTVAEKVEHPSAFEQVNSHGTLTNFSASPGMFKRSVIVTYACAGCAAVKVERL